MPIPVQCQECAAKYNLKDHLEGKTIRCPKCQAKIVVTRSTTTAKPAGPRKVPAQTPPPDEDNEEPASVKDRPSIAREPARLSKKNIILAVIGGAAASLCVLCMGFGIYTEQSKKGGLAYNDTMTNAQSRLSRSRGIFIEHVKRFRKADDPEEMAVLRKEYRDMETTINAVRAEIPTWSVPWSAGSLHESYQRYFAFEQEAMPKFAEAMRILANATLPMRQRHEGAERIVNEIEATERVHFAELDRVQREFARDHGFVLQPNVIVIP